MRSLLILLVFLNVGLCGYSQVRSFTFRTGLPEAPCDSLYKEIRVFVISGGRDSLIMSSSFFECGLQFYIDAPDSLFRLRITSENGSAGELLINTALYSDSVNDLGIITLKRGTQQLDEFTVTGIKKSFIKVEADKKTVTVKDNPVLTTSSVYDAILKIPGVVPFPGSGFAVNGRFASIYFENVPSSLGTDDLLNLLKSLPATSVERIEIISNPGASYDANVSGAIINIITMAKVSGYISGTVTLNYGLNQNNKLVPSFTLSGKNSRFSWQFQSGYSYYERTFLNTYTRVFNSFEPDALISTERSDHNKSGFFYFKPSLNYKINKRSSLILNYNLSLNNSSNRGVSATASEQVNPPVSAIADYTSKGNSNNNEVILKYRLNLDTLRRVFSATASYSGFSGDNLNKTAQNINGSQSYSLLGSNSAVQRFFVRADVELPFDSLKLYVSTGLKFSNLAFSNSGRYNLQNPSAAIFDTETFNDQLDFHYAEQNYAAYADVKKGIGRKLTLGAGIRAENFMLNRYSDNQDALRNNYFNLFPSVNALYRIFPDIHFIATYSRKISIPSYNQFDPNNSGYYDNYNSTVGNVALKPNFYDNYEVKLTVFDYLEVSMSYSHSQSLNLNQTIAEPNSLATVQTYQTYNNVNVLTNFFALPVPISIFSKGMKFFEEPLDVDNLNFVYLYAQRMKTSVGGLELNFRNKPLWHYGTYSQFVLPWKIKLNVNAWLGNKGVYQLYGFTKQRSAVEAVISREFYNKKLRASISVQDIFNRNQNNIRTSFPNIDLDNYTKDDTRIVWFKVSYSFGKFEKPESEGFSIGKPPETQP